MYAWTAEPWSESIDANEDSVSLMSNQRRAAQCTPTNLPLLHDVLDVLHDVAEAFHLPTAPMDLAKIGIGVGEAIGGMQQGMTRRNEDAVFNAYGIDPSERDNYRMEFRYCPRSPQDIANEFLPDFIELRAQNRARRAARSILDGASSGCPKVLPNRIDVWIPGDPNEITGYVSESGSHYITTDVRGVGYDIEFENDPELANASAHHIVITDTLDAKHFDLNSFAPKTIKVSGKEVELDGKYPFVKTIDMRPEIYAIAEVRCDFDKNKGIATWNLISLDPMTMEPTDDIMQGILPVNTSDGNGIGNVTYTINLRNNLTDGTEIDNRASIIFDYNDPILTPTWTNIIDAVPPTSRVTDVIPQNDSIASIYFESDDERSGVWKHDVYVQYGEDAPWVKMTECSADSDHVDFRYYDGMDYGFCVLATDSAGNVEQKELKREGDFVKVKLGDVNCDGEVNTHDATLTIGYYLEQPVYILGLAADVNGDGEINTHDATLIIQMYLDSNSVSLAKERVVHKRARINKTTSK